MRMCADKKGTLRSKTGGNIGFVDTFSPFNVKDVLRTATIRSVARQMLVLKVDTRCFECAVFRCTLRRKYSRWLSAKDKPSKFANNFTLTTPQRHRKLQQLSKAKKKPSDTKISKLAAAVQLLVKRNRFPVKSSMHGDVLKVGEETDRFVLEAFPEGSFRRLIWEEQKKAASCKSANGMRWHSLIIRWARSMTMASSSAYHIMRTCGMIRLPSERTLRDYTHFFKQTAGFNSGSNHQLVPEARLVECSDVQKHVTLVFDEMK